MSYYAYDDYDPPLITELSVKIVTAKKEYKCYVCGTMIKVGEKYKKTVIKNDDNDKIETWKQHEKYCINDEF